MDIAEHFKAMLNLTLDMRTKQKAYFDAATRSMRGEDHQMQRLAALAAAKQAETNLDEFLFSLMKELERVGGGQYA